MSFASCQLLAYSWRKSFIGIMSHLFWDHCALCEEFLAHSYVSLMSFSITKPTQRCGEPGEEDEAQTGGMPRSLHFKVIFERLSVYKFDLNLTRLYSEIQTMDIRLVLLHVQPVPSLVETSMQSVRCGCLRQKGASIIANSSVPCSHYCCYSITYLKHTSKRCGLIFTLTDNMYMHTYVYLYKNTYNACMYIM